MDKSLTINILTFFIIYSFLGWILESTYKSIMNKKIINSGFLHGPFCPIYGIGAIILYLSLKEFKANPILVFFIGFVALSIWEYFVGWILEKMFNTKYWDYTNNKFNIRGRVCLLNSVFWGILGVIFIEVISPFVESRIILLNGDLLINMNILIYSYLIVDVIASIVKVKNIDIKLKSITEIGEIIKQKLEKLEELKESTESKQVNLESLQNIIEELKLKQQSITKKLYKQVTRLKKVFPTIKSDSINKILSQKKEEIKNKQKEK